MLGQPYGLTYEIEKGKLVQSAERTNQADSCEWRVSSLLHLSSRDRPLNTVQKGNVEDIEATNENIKESAGAQKMTGDDIEELKKAGLTGRVSQSPFSGSLVDLTSD